MYENFYQTVATFIREFETNYSTNKAWGNDDLGIVTPNSNDDVNKGYGTSKVNEGQDRY